MEGPGLCGRRLRDGRTRPGSLAAAAAAVGPLRPLHPGSRRGSATRTSEQPVQPTSSSSTERLRQATTCSDSTCGGQTATHQPLTGAARGVDAWQGRRGRGGRHRLPSCPVRQRPTLPRAAPRISTRRGGAHGRSVKKNGLLLCGSCEPAFRSRSVAMVCFQPEQRKSDSRFRGADAIFPGIPEHRGALPQHGGRRRAERRGAAAAPALSGGRHPSGNVPVG